MSKVIHTAGWYVAINRCDHIDHEQGDDRWFAVNLIIPQAGDESTATWLAEKFAAPKVTGDEAENALGDFLRPWNWKNLKWRLYQCEKGSNAWNPVVEQTLEYGTPEVERVQRDYLRRSLEAELSDRTEACEEAFSVDDARWHGHPTDDSNAPALIEQSWPHALAALTHTPIGLSNATFQFGGFLVANKNTLVDESLVVAFPVMEIDGTLYEPLSVAEVNSRIAAPYKPDFIDPDGKPVKFIFATEAVPWTPIDLAGSTKAVFKEGLRARGAVDRLFASHLLPLEILGDALTKLDYSNASPDLESIIKIEPFPQVEWQLALLRCLGSAWMRLRFSNDGGWRRPHLLQFAQKREQLEELLEAYSPGNPGGLSAALEAGFRDITPAEAPGLLALWASAIEKNEDLKPATDILQKIIPPLPNGGDVNARRVAVQDFFAAWNRIATEILGEGGRRLMAAWIKVRLEVQADSVADAQKEAALHTLANTLPDLTTDTLDQLLMGALDTAKDSSPIWPALTKLANVRDGDTTAARRAIETAVTDWAEADVPATVLPTTFQSAFDTAWVEKFSPDFASQGGRHDARPHDEGLWLEFQAEEVENTGGNDVDQKIRGFAIALCTGIRAKGPNGRTFADCERAQWVTQTTIRLANVAAANPQEPLLRAKDHPEPAWYPLTVGSSLVGGRRVGQAIYAGAPLSSIPEDRFGRAFDHRDLDDTRSLDYRWPEVAVDPDDPNKLKLVTLPLLGYGTEATGKVTALDNAGGVIDTDLRGTKVGAVLDAKKLAWQLDAKFSVDSTIRYESHVPPAAPRLIAITARDIAENPCSIDLTELTSETRALRYLSQQLEQVNSATPETFAATREALISNVVLGAAPPRVACLVHGDKTDKKGLWRLDRPAQLTLQFRAPQTYVDFVRAWLATDQLVLGSGFTPEEKEPLFSDTLFRDNPTLFPAFREKVAPTRLATASPNAISEYNPAVTALGIELKFFSTPSVTRLPPFPVDTTMLKKDKNGQDYIDYGATIISLKVNSKPGALQLPTQANDWTLTLPPSVFVRIRVYSLVHKDRFAPVREQGEPGPHAGQRFSAAIGKAEQGEWRDYRAFGPIEYWVEALPAWSHPGNPEPDKAYFDVEVVPPDLKDQPTLTRLNLKRQPIASLPADWIRAVEVMRHRWHWTGFPVQFPPVAEADQLERWLPAFAGVESLRQRTEITLLTRVDGNDWRYGDRVSPLTIDTQRDEDHERPSRYVAYSVRPKVRFARWLNPPSMAPAGKNMPLHLERDLFAAGQLAKGLGDFSESSRLPTPAFRFKIPLTASYQFDPAETLAAIKLHRSNNGCLLIFDDAMRRTDSFTRLGGIGDAVEVDLLQTRVIKIGQQERSFSQIGPNPIFHRSPTAKSTDPEIIALKQSVLEVSPPHGLTYDLVRNGKVAQTAVAVRPVSKEGEAPRDWVLAQVRVRRLILPETQLNASVTNRANLFELNWRREGEDRIPLDFAVDYDAKAAERPVLKLSAEGKPYDIVIPQNLDLPTQGRVRLLVSFHKGRWQSGGQPYWSPQVLVQKPRRRRTTGEAVLGWDTHSQAPCYGRPEWLPREGKLELTVSGVTQNIECAHAQLSDYTDPRWLLFIGRIPGTGTQRPEDYQLEPVIENGKLVRLRVTVGELALLRRPPQTKQDWRRPELASDVNAPTAEIINTEFFVMFVSGLPSDVMAATTGGAPLGMLAFQPDEHNAREFVPLGTAPKIAEGDLIGATALLCGFQRITSTSKQEQAVEINSLPKLLEHIFPDPADNDLAKPREALIRPTGSHWGPMPITALGKVPA